MTSEFGIFVLLCRVAGRLVNRVEGPSLDKTPSIAIARPRPRPPLHFSDRPMHHIFLKVGELEALHPGGKRP